jgi:hypothetical protein
MNFPVGIPANQPLQNGQNIDFVAPAIVAGEPFGNQVNDAALEFELRQVLFTRTPNAVTAQELNASRVRYVAVETSHAQITYGMGTAAVMAAIKNLENRLADLQAQNIGHRLTALEAQTTNLITSFDEHDFDFRDHVEEFQGHNIGGRFNALETQIANLVAGVQGHSIGNRLSALELQVANRGVGLANTENQVPLANQGVAAGMEQSTADLKTTLQVLTDELQHFYDSSHSYIAASFRNMRARERNREDDRTPLVVEKRGVNTINVVPPIHPLSYEAFLEMDNEQIDALEKQFNLPEGHFKGGEAMNVRQEAVLHYLTEW